MAARGVLRAAALCLAAVSVCAAAVTVTPKQAWSPTKEVADLLAALKADKQFSQVVGLMSRAGPQGTFLHFLEVLLTANAATLFLPTDAAFAKLNAALRTKLKTGSVKSLHDALKMLTVTPRLSQSQLYALRKGTYLLSVQGSLLQREQNKNLPNLMAFSVVGGSKAIATTVVKDKRFTTALSVQGIDTWLLPPGWK